MTRRSTSAARWSLNELSDRADGVHDVVEVSARDACPRSSRRISHAPWARPSLQSNYSASMDACAARAMRRSCTFEFWQYHGQYGLCLGLCRCSGCLPGFTPCLCRMWMYTRIRVHAIRIAVACPYCTNEDNFQRVRRCTSRAAVLYVGVAAVCNMGMNVDTDVYLYVCVW